MAICVSRVGGVHRLAGDAALVGIANGWLAHLEARNFSSATVRGYAYDLVCRYRHRGGRLGCGRVDAVCWVTSSPGDRPGRAGLFVRTGRCPRASRPTTSKCSSPI